MITIRPSTLPSYQDCPRRTVARSYPQLVRDVGVDLRPTMMPVGAAVGTAAHAGVSYILQAKMDAGDLGNKDDAIQRGLEAFDGAIQDGALWDDMTPQPATAHEQIRRMVLTYRVVLAPTIEPSAVEQRLNARLDDQFELSGQKDVATREPNRIRDLKTGARPRSHIAQYGAYALIERAHGRPAQQVVEDYLPRAPLSRPQPQPVSLAMPADYAERVSWSVLERMRADIRRFLELRDPLVFPANPSSQLCSPRYCPAYGTPWCREHRGAL